MSDYSASVAYGEPVLVEETDEISEYPSASASYLNPSNESVSVVDSYFFDIIDELAQDPDFIQDFGPVAMPIAQTNARPISATDRRPPVSAMSYAVADDFVTEAGILPDSASYVGSPSFPDSFYFNVIEDQVQIQQYNQFLLDEERKKQALAESKQMFCTSPVTYAIPASTFEKSLTEEKESEEWKSCLAEEGNYGWNEKASALEFAPMKAPRLNKKLNRAIKQKNNVKAIKYEKPLKMPSVVTNFKLATDAGLEVTGVSAKSKAASMRQRVEGKFKKLQTKWVSAAEFFVKTNSNSPVSPYSQQGVGTVGRVDPYSHRVIDTLPNYGTTTPLSAVASGSGAAVTGGGVPGARSVVVNPVWNKWTQPPLDYGLPSGMQLYSNSASGGSSSSSSSGTSSGAALGHGVMPYGTGGTHGNNYTSRFGKLDISSGVENS